MMSINRVISFVILASFVVLGYIQTTTADYITVKKLRGTWYNVATSLEESETAGISCSKINIMRGKDGGSFTYVATTVFDSDMRQIVATGEIKNSALHISFQSPINRTIVNDINFYNNDKEFIQYCETDRNHYDLFSRTTSVSAGARRVFERHIADAGLQWSNVNQDDCP